MRVFPISSLLMPVNLIQYKGTVGMFNNRRFPSSSLSYSYFGKKYHNDDTFTLAIGLIILSLWHLIYVSSNWKFRSLFLSDLVGICNKFLRKILYLTLYPLRKEGGVKTTEPLLHSNFLKNFRKYKLVWAVFLSLSIYNYLTYSEKSSGFCSSQKSGSGYFVGRT